MKTLFKKSAALILGALMLLSLTGCYTWRVAKRPAETEQQAYVSETPSELPTEEATPAPTEEETPAPTEEATPTPTGEETPAPTEEATPAPTEEATPAPTGEETPAPTAGLTPTPKPTPAPTPAHTPTPKPTPAPTPKPTEAPKPDFVFKTYDIVNNREYTESIFAKKKLTMINFWATWCGPCIEELPNLQRLSNNYSKLQVITVLYDSGDSGAINTAVSIMNANGITLPALRYNNSMKQAFGGYLSSAALPTTVFVDQDGHFVKCVNGAKSYDEWCAIINGML